MGKAPFRKEIPRRPGADVYSFLVVPLYAGRQSTGLQKMHDAPDARARILVVDDDQLVRASMRRILGRSHAVTTAADGAEALEILRAGNSFGLIFCDIMMPGMNGVAFFGAVSRELPEQ